MWNVNLMIPGEIFFQFNFVLLSSRLYNETFSKSAGKITNKCTISEIKNSIASMPPSSAKS